MKASVPGALSDALLGMGPAAAAAIGRWQVLRYEDGRYRAVSGLIRRRRFDNWQMHIAPAKAGA